MKATQLQLLQDCVDTIALQHPKYDREKLLDRARKVAVSLAAMGSFGIVKRVSIAVGSADLKETYKRLPDQDVAVRRLVHLSIELDHFGEFPMTRLREAARVFRDRPLPKWILRQMATQHIRLFPVSYATKQRVCQELEITFEQLQSPEQPKLLK